MKKTARTFAGRIQSARTASKKTLAQLAKECGFSSRQNLHDWLNKQSREADLKRFARLAEALGVRPAWLAFGER